MYLLIHVLRTSVLLVPQFTSHYVSINSLRTGQVSLIITYLHPTMYLLIRPRNLCNFALADYLHPTMYLLIRPRNLCNFALADYLHPTMYLLILKRDFISSQLRFHLHPTMYLLIPALPRALYVLFKEIYIPLCIY